MVTQEEKSVRLILTTIHVFMFYTDELLPGPALTLCSARGYSGSDISQPLQLMTFEAAGTEE